MERPGARVVGARVEEHLCSTWLTGIGKQPRPNWLPLTFRIDDEDRFSIDEVEILSFRQELGVRRGVLRRKPTFRFRRQVLDVEATHETLRISGRAFTAEPITGAYHGRFRDVSPGDVYEFRLLKPGEKNRDGNRRARSAPDERGEAS